MTEKEKMLNGKLYNCINDELFDELFDCYNLCLKYNQLGKDQVEERKKILKQLVPDSADTAYLNGPIHFDFGKNIHLGEHFYANSNLTILDCAPVYIGDYVLFGPNVSILTPMHPLLKEERRQIIKDGIDFELQYTKPVRIENDVWICSNVVVLPGVTIHEGAVIGAGSVVTHDIPANVLAAGNPCKVIRELTEEDSVFKKKELL